MRKIITKHIGKEINNILGTPDDLYYDPVTRTLKASDGSTVGGITLNPNTNTIKNDNVFDNSGYNFPSNNGLPGQVLVTDGNGNLRWGGIGNLEVTDSTISSKSSVSMETGSRDHWVAIQQRQGDGPGIYGMSARYDSQGNLIMLSFLEQDTNSLLITKYSSEGSVLWQKRIEEIGSNGGLSVDAYGNIFVAIYLINDSLDIGILKLNGINGTILWQIQLGTVFDDDGFNIEVDKSGHLILSGTTWSADEGTSSDCLVMKLNGTTSEIMWQKTLGNEFFQGIAGLTVDYNNNIILSGYDGTNENNKMLIAKYDTFGNLVWAKSIESPNDYNIYSGDVSVDALGNLYFIANFDVDNVTEFPLNSTASIVFKTNPHGVIQWSRRIGPGPCDSVGTSIEVTAGGEIYVAASTFQADDVNFDFGISGGNKQLVARYDVDGNVLWQRYLDSPGLWEGSTSNELFFGNPGQFSVDPRGQLLSVFGDKVSLCGSGVQFSDEFGPGTQVAYVAQLPKSGEELTIGEFEFVKSKVSGLFITLESVDIELNDSEGTLILTPIVVEFVSTNIANKFFKTEKYNFSFDGKGTLNIPNDGDLQLHQSQIGWVSIYGDLINFNNDTWFQSVISDDEGYVYAVGGEDDTGNPIVVKFDDEGKVLWSIRLEDNNGNNGQANIVVLDPSNGDVVVGCEFYSGDPTKVAIVRLDPGTGYVKEVETLSDDSNLYPSDLLFDKNGRLIVVGEKDVDYETFENISPLSGSATAILHLSLSELNNMMPESYNYWYVSGTDISDKAQIIYVNLYQNLTATSGTGVGLAIDIFVNNSTGFYENDSINNGGNSYQLGDVLTIPGTTFAGGTSPTNDLTLTVTSVGLGGEISGITLSGNAPSNFARLVIDQSPNFSGEGSWNVLRGLSSEGFIWTPDWQLTLGGGTTGDNDYFSGVSVDSLNNLYTIGAGYGDELGEDLAGYRYSVLNKFDSDGNIQWSKILNDSNDNCNGQSVVVDSEDYILTSHQNSNYNQSVITKLDQDGEVLWKSRSVGGEDADDCGIAIDDYDDIYSLAEIDTGGEYEDALIITKLDGKSGHVMWQRMLSTLEDDRIDYNNGSRWIYVKGDYLYIAGYTDSTVNDYNTAIIAKLPTDGQGIGNYGYWKYSEINYGYESVDKSAVDFTPRIVESNISISEYSDIYADWYSRENNLEIIRDQDGGAIVFPDGSTQNSSATDIPQTRVQGGSYKLGLRDRGRHVYCTGDSDATIIVPYNSNESFPIGTAITIINNTDEYNVNIDSEGESISIIVPGSVNSNYWDLSWRGMATLIKVDVDTWFLTGGPLSQD